jgi:hypothetical protein
MGQKALGKKAQGLLDFPDLLCIFISVNINTSKRGSGHAVERIDHINRRADDRLPPGRLLRLTRAGGVGSGMATSRPPGALLCHLPMHFSRARYGSLAVHTIAS